MAGGEIALRLIGPPALLRDGVAQPLPASRKTRALLAYLAVSGRPERRERLCELFWDLPDDPRGALRWSLSKLRGLLDDPGAPRLRADREEVSLLLPDDAIDWRRLRALVRRGPAQASVEALEGALGSGAFLEGLDLPRCDGFTAWCIAQREDVRRWRAALLAELTARDLPVDAALAHARAWVEIDGHAPAAWARLVALLDRAGRTREAAEQRQLGARRVGGPIVPAAAAPAKAGASPAPSIHFCISSDGTNLAFTASGEGPPLIKIANWMTHLELDADGPIWRHWIAEFSRDRRLVRYDHRGNGLSDRTVRFGLDAEVADLEAVVAAAGADRFDLLAVSQGATVAIAYAARHPERVRRLVLLGGFAQGWAVRGAPEEIARRQAMLTLTRQGWGLDNPAFRQMFTSLFLPDGTPEEQAWFNDLQRTTTSAENACAVQLSGAETDVAALLPLIATPTLVAHRRDDAIVPFDAGRAIAQAIPGARFLALEGRNHMLLAHEPAWRRFVEATRAFLDG